MSRSFDVFFSTPPILNVDANYYLREHTVDDAAPFLAYYTASPEANQYILMPVPQNLEEARDRILIRRSHFKHHSGFYWALANKKDDIIIGTAGLMSLNTYDKNAILCYELNQQYWGSGLAYKMVLTVLNYAFNTLGLERITAEIMSENLRSSGLVKKFGFQLEAHARHSRYFRNQYQDIDVYALIREDFAKHLSTNQ